MSHKEELETVFTWKVEFGDPDQIQAFGGDNDEQCLISHYYVMAETIDAAIEKAKLCADEDGLTCIVTSAKCLFILDEPLPQ
jgi:hypothetical protein